MDPYIGILCATKRLAAMRNHYDDLCQEMAEWSCEVPTYPVDIDAAFNEAMIAEARLIAELSSEAETKAK